VDRHRGGAARGGRIASWPSLKTDLRNAGAEWVDQEVVCRRQPGVEPEAADIPAFNRAMIDLFSRLVAGRGGRRDVSRRPAGSLPDCGATNRVPREKLGPGASPSGGADPAAGLR